MSFLWHDVRDAGRALARTRGFTAVVLLTLALGIGVNAAIFTLVDAVFLRPLPYPDAERLVLVAEWPRSGGNYTVAPAAYLRWRDEVTSFAHFEARVATALVWLQGEAPEQLRGARVTPDYFAMLGARMIRGRAFAPDDARAEAPCVAIVTHRLWTSHLAGDEAALGRPMRFSGRACTLVGVLPADSAFDRAAVDVYVPLQLSAAERQSNGRQLTVLARLRPGVALEQARTEMATLGTAFNAQRGDAGRGWTTAVTPLRDIVIRGESRSLARVLGGAVLLVLIVAGLNVAGLSLSRSVARRREIAIRCALGASRWRLVRYLVIESLLLSLGGGAIGLLLASWVIRALTVLAPQGLLPAETTVALDLRALFFTLAVSVVVGLVFGTVPALRGTADSARVLAASGRTAGPSKGTGVLHGTLLVAEVALATVVVMAATSLAISFARLIDVDPGFTARQVITMRVSVPPGVHDDGAAAVFIQDLLVAFRGVNGVSHAGAVTSLPLGGWLFGTTFSVEGEPAEPDRPPAAHIQTVTPDYFEALGIPLAAGRAFTDKDGARSQAVAIVNETFVRRFIPDGRVIGRHMRLGSSGVPREIVGILRDVKTGGLDDAALATPEIYVPHQQQPAGTVFVAVSAASGDPTRLVPDLRAAARRLDPELPLGALLSMDQRIGVSVRQQRFRTGMIGASAVLALLLACLGVYAVRAHAVAARIREMGIRLALGAAPRELLRMVLGQGLLQVGVGALGGFGGAVWANRFVRPWLFATELDEPRVVGLTLALLAVAAIVASWVPARRAARVDPQLLLREE